MKSLEAPVHTRRQHNHLGYLDRAEPHRLRAVFERYASCKIDGELFMTDRDFFVSYLNIFDDDYDKNTARLLGGVLDQSKDGLISYKEFEAFEGRLCMPDALYRTAFQLFDGNGNGTVSFEEFQNIVKQTCIYQEIEFPFDSVEVSDFIKLHFGKNKDRSITYMEFSQFLHDFHDVYAEIAFKAHDNGGDGFISTDSFVDILMKLKPHLLTDTVRHEMRSVVDAVCHAPTRSSNREYGRVSYSFFTAFISLFSNMELIKRVYLNASSGSRTTEITKDEFLHSSQMMSQVTPLEIEILYKFCEVALKTSTIIYSDLRQLAPEQYMKQITQRLTEIHAVSSPEERGVVIQMLESAYRFSLGSIAGAIGATAVYPIDLVKTRMQNQRVGIGLDSGSSYEVAYRNSADCFRKVLKYEGVFGFYRGLLPQIMGVAPEKAIKLTVNDLVRDKVCQYNNNVLPLWAEILAGGCAGAAQVLFTNPLEIVKIRLQVAGEVKSAARPSAWTVFKDLWLIGLYKGAPACLLRDVPFSAIFFPTYEHMKQQFVDDTGYNAPGSLLLSGLIAGAPAATLVTPADVIKTRLQVVARSGQTMYNGVVDAAKKIYAEEGFRAFWKGSMARMCRSSPQFGVTLFVYEILQRKFYVDFAGSQPSGSTAEMLDSSAQPSTNVDHVGGYQVAKPIFSGLESKFGLIMPRKTSPAPPPAGG